MAEKMFVAHDCRNSRHPETIFSHMNGKKKVYVPNPEFCNERWVDVDMTGAKMQIPTWKYCRKCCEKLGIDFEKQKPSDYRTDEQNERLRARNQKMKEGRENNKVKNSL